MDVIVEEVCPPQVENGWRLHRVVYRNPAFGVFDIWLPVSMPGYVFQDILQDLGQVDMATIMHLASDYSKKGA